MVYLSLFHGRNSASDELDDWGFEGPVFKAKYFHTTYGCQIKFEQGEEYCTLDIVDDMVVYQGKYYGDWTISGSPERPVTKWQPEVDG